MSRPPGAGWVGMKATHGLVPSYGLTYMDHTIDHIGPITKTVADSARMLEVTRAATGGTHNGFGRHQSPGAISLQTGWAFPHFGWESSADHLSRRDAPQTCSPRSRKPCPSSPGSARRLSTTSRCRSGLTPRPSRWAPWVLGCTGWPLPMASASDMGRVDPVVTAGWAAQSQAQADDLPAALKSILVATDYVLEHHQGVPIAKAHNLRLTLRHQMRPTRSAARASDHRRPLRGGPLLPGRLRPGGGPGRLAAADRSHQRPPSDSIALIDPTGTAFAEAQGSRCRPVPAR